jgi:predicted negative regulator of RcsB-dependent stress response
LVSAIFASNVYTNKLSNEKAAGIYNQWLISSASEKSDVESLYLDLVNNYPNTGYSMMAMLAKGAELAENGNYEESIEVFSNLKDLTDGFNGNKFFNKISRVSISRIHIHLEQFDEALLELSGFSEESTNAYIHELIGDIFAAKNDKSRSLEQYEFAKNKYDDQQAKSIVSMKIANISLEQ